MSKEENKKTFKDIAKPLVNTKGWKFDREEANERDTDKNTTVDNELDPEFKEAIHEMAKRIQELNEIRLAIIKPRLENVIRNRITDRKIVEQLFDELIDCAGLSEEGVELFKRLCRYYFPIDPTATAKHICLYRDLYDNDDDEEVQEETI